MLILGIETSCDETALSLLRYHDQSNFEIITELVSSQVELHANYGGVVPELASRAHMQALPLMFEHLLKQSQVEASKISAVAVTQGPGLKGCLLMGLSFAQALSLALQIPFVAVNHLEGHLLSVRLKQPDFAFPYLALIVSGGHTEIIEVRGVGDYYLRCRTIDDAAGEAFDKSANLLGLDYPGGAKLAQMADSCDHSPFVLPKVMRETEGFSFSGLKTAIALLAREQQEAIRSPEIKAALAYAIQDSIVDALLFKLRKELESTEIKRVAISGGVSANQRLRKLAAGLPNCEVLFPDSRHCVDNASMIAYAGAVRFAAGERSFFGAPAVSRWPVETLSPA
ncbi:MAG: tRNA (adenosine(37)-N6)-threonylcarbamoyltransferase complex transferase subunit TsaD [Bdellovibrionales bacterium]|nr:tRNA (adenosine(37)-N6)-threonylcarbamoyltransferase complex transferase subunit TsaD [Bdellovibrionales bacterium]